MPYRGRASSTQRRARYPSSVRATVEVSSPSVPPISAMTSTQPSTHRAEDPGGAGEGRSVAVALADDSLIVREGIERILAGRPGHRGGRVLRRPALTAGGGRQRTPRRRRHRHPDAADRHRRGHPRRRRCCARRTPRSASSCSASTPSPRTPWRCLESGSEGRAYLLKERVHDRAPAGRGDRGRRRRRLGDGLQGRRAARRRQAARRALAPGRRSPAASARSSAEIAQGKSNAAIADTLVLTKRAVEKHINSIFLKLDLAYSRGRQQARQGRPALPRRSRHVRCRVAAG